MSFYSDASVVMIPSGYKTSKVYCAVPTDGAADLSFSRSNDTATRVGPDGLIEKVRTNLVTYSQAFDNAAWTKLDVSVTANAAANPLDGESTADNIVPSVVSGGHYVNQSHTLTANVPYTISVYAKANGYDWIYLYADGSGSGQYQLFNVSNGTLGLAAGTATKTITAVGGGWYRCTLSWVPSVSGSIIFQIAPLSSNSVSAFAGDGTSGVLFYAAQFETGDIATDYIATTTAAVSVGPVANVPRLDYLNSSCPRLLLEPQRTNSALYSEQFDNSDWTKNNQSVTANNTTAPDGYSSADLLIPTAGTGDHYVLSSTVNNASAQATTLSIFVKKKDHDYFYFGTGGASAFGAVVYRFSTNTFTVSGLGATATNYGNGWIRLTITGTTGATDLRMLFTPTDATGSRTFNANGTDGTWIWGAQCENSASYATSYIPTLGAAVTRGADDCVKTSATSIIGQTEGVVYFEWEYQNVGSSGGNIVISLDGGSGKELYFWVQTNGVYLTEGFDGSVNQFSFTGAMGSFGTKKIAIAYKNNDFALYINGVLAGTDTSGSVPTLDRLYVGRYFANTSYNIASGIKQVLLFKTRLSNDSLASLTSL